MSETIENNFIFYELKQAVKKGSHVKLIDIFQTKYVVDDRDFPIIINIYRDQNVQVQVKIP